MNSNSNTAAQHRGIEVNTPFRCTTPVQIRYTDYDMQGHVNNSVYLNFFDTAKMDYFKQVQGSDFDWDDVAVVIAHIEADYLQPTLYYEGVVAQTQTVHLGDKSLTLVQRLVNASNRQVKCVCRTVLVYIDPATRQPAPIPAVWRQAITRFEHREM